MTEMSPPPLILASASPRRAELLRQIGLAYQVVASHIDEPPPIAGEDVLAWAQRAALDKARATATRITDASPRVILGADTAVVLDADEHAGAPRLHGKSVEVLGKPHDVDEARRMLTSLSGRTHLVVSAFALLSHPDGKYLTDAVVTEVVFRTLTPDEIEAYLATGEPLDKAGAYGIQGHGAILIERIVGDYYTVVGLPLARLWERLHEF